MLKKPACPVIAIEEHYWDKELSDTYSGIGRATQNDEAVRRLLDLGEVRLQAKWTRPASTCRCCRTVRPRRSN